MLNISVITPLYNKEKYIKIAIESVLTQTFTDFELIIVNDGCTDNSMNVVKKISDKRIKIINQENKGVSAARNIGIENASGELLAFLDADDIWLPNHLQILFDLHQNFPNAGILATKYLFIYKNKKKRYPHFQGIKKNFRGIVPDFFRSSLQNRLALTSAIAIPKNVLLTIGKFDVTLDTGAGEDTDLWIRIALKYPVAFNANPSVYYATEARNKLSLRNNQKTSFPTFEKFEEIEKNNQSLKRFLDRYRIEYAVKHKIAGNKKQYLFYKTAIHKKHLNRKAKLLLWMPRFLLIIFYNFKKKLEQNYFFVDVYC